MLPINLFNQQVFTIIWLWYLFVLAFNIVMFFSWLQKAVPSKAKKWISKRVNLINRTMSSKKIRLEHFLGKYLEADGLFMIRMIANNTSDYVATDVIHNLWCKKRPLLMY